MKCQNHPDHDAENFCASCGIPICNDCTEKSSTGDPYCFQCAMLHSVSEVGTSLSDKKEKVDKKKLLKKKPWGPFHYFVIVSSTLIAVMWIVIIFGGEKAPGKKINFAQQGRVFLFMVDSSIKRFAHYEGNRYPEDLADLVPKYLPINKEDIPELGRLIYKQDPKTGYSLSFANPKPGEMNIIITPKGIKYEPVLSEGV